MILRATASLLLAATLAACAEPYWAPPQTNAAAAPAPAPPTPPAAPPTEHLDLALHAGDLTWQSGGAGDLPGGGTMQEYVPGGETIADWTQMITVLTLPPTQSPDARLTAILNGLRAACKSYRVVQSATQPAPNPSTNLLARCDQPDETAFNDANILLLKHEVIWAKTIQGHAGNYVVWRAWHGNAIAVDSVLGSRSARQEWQDWVDQVVLDSHGA
jgi:hypothetical protein